LPAFSRARITVAAWAISDVQTLFVSMSFHIPKI
jgi:hypothetical protein